MYWQGSEITNWNNSLSAGRAALRWSAMHSLQNFVKWHLRFFDEATSAPDANNEKIILENLKEFFNGKTVVVIAHRLSTVKTPIRSLYWKKAGS
jgi:ABC-type transport system involved in cytochrome bd biosynthesis fused ATPase/permease subunit